MISRISGRLTMIDDGHALVENNGVAYEILLPSALADRLKDHGRVGEDISFETIYYIEAGDKKAAHFPKLVGFDDAIDREFFSLFTQVPGLGVKKALKSLILPEGMGRRFQVSAYSRDLPAPPPGFDDPFATPPSDDGEGGDPVSPPERRIRLVR